MPILSKRGPIAMWTEAILVRKGRSTEVQRVVSKLGNEHQHLFVPSGGYVFMLGNGEGKRHLPSPLFLDKYSINLCPSSVSSEISKEIFWYSPGISQTAISMLYLCLHLVVLSLKGEDSVFSCPPSSSRATPSDFI